MFQNDENSTEDPARKSSTLQNTTWLFKFWAATIVLQSFNTFYQQAQNKKIMQSFHVRYRLKTPRQGTVRHAFN